MQERYQKLGRIGVLMGGCSSEREISLKSGKAVYQALANAGCLTVPLEMNSTQSQDIVLLRFGNVPVCPLLPLQYEVLNHLLLCCAQCMYPLRRLPEPLVFCHTRVYISNPFPRS